MIKTILGTPGNGKSLNSLNRIFREHFPDAPLPDFIKESKKTNEKRKDNENATVN